MNTFCRLAQYAKLPVSFHYRGRRVERRQSATEASLLRCCRRSAELARFSRSGEPGAFRLGMLARRRGLHAKSPPLGRGCSHLTPCRSSPITHDPQLLQSSGSGQPRGLWRPAKVHCRCHGLFLFSTISALTCEDVGHCHKRCWTPFHLEYGPSDRHDKPADPCVRRSPLRDARRAKGSRRAANRHM